MTDPSLHEIARRLTAIEQILNERVVVKDVYLAEKHAIQEALAYERGARIENVREIKEDISDLQGFRKAVYGLLFTLLAAVLTAFLTWALAGGLR